MNKSRRHAEPESAPAQQLLIQQAQRGRPQAMHALVDQYADALYSTALYMLGCETDAQDAVQETLMAMVANIRRFEARSTFRTWLWGILVRQVNRRLRDRIKHRRQPDVSPQSSLTPDQLTQVHMDVRAALAQISDEHRQVLILREFDSLSYDQIAQMLDVPRGTVESRLHRARAAMRQLLHDYASTEVPTQ